MAAEHDAQSASPDTRRNRPDGGCVTRSNAERYLRHAGRWVKTSELAKHLGLVPSTVIEAMRGAERAGTVQSKNGGRDGLSWRWVSQEATDRQRFLIDWPPGWVSRWDEARRAIP